MDPRDVAPELGAVVAALDDLRLKIGKRPVGPRDVPGQEGVDSLDIVRELLQVTRELRSTVGVFGQLAARADRVALFLVRNLELTATQSQELAELLRLDYGDNNAGEQG